MKRKLQCPDCQFSCVRGSQFLNHLITDHCARDIESYYIDRILNGEVPLCKCGCGAKPKFIGWNFGFAEWIKGHNGRLSSLPPDQAEITRNRRKEALTGKAGWSRGLSKKNNEAIAKAAASRSVTVKKQFAEGGRKSWNRGKKKETDIRVAAAAATQKEKFATGVFVPWAKGKTKETDEKVFQMSCNVASTLRQQSLRQRLDGLKRLTTDEVKRRISENCRNIELLSSTSEYRRDSEKNLLFKCKLCGLEQHKSLIQAMNDRCDDCHPKGSSAQIAIAEILKSWGFDVIISDRSLIKPYEIDILLNEQKFCVEFNGLYFHSEIWKGKSYHSDKSEMCKKLGYQLFHVFEDEWREKRDIVLSMLRHRLGRSQIKINARDCEIRSLSSNNRQLFFSQNHIDGDAKASGAWGLFHPAYGLVAAASVRNPMHKIYKQKVMLELARFCTKLDCHVRGGLSKLLSHCESFAVSKGYAGMLTYVDTRHGTGQGYMSCDYAYVKNSSNRFWWTDGKHRIDRFKIRADKNQGLSEKDIADSHGVVKIWGTPNLLFEKLFD